MEAGEGGGWVRRRRGEGKGGKGTYQSSPTTHRRDAPRRAKGRRIAGRSCSVCVHINVSITISHPCSQPRLPSSPPTPNPYRMESRQAATTEKNRALTWVASSRCLCRMEAGKK